MASKIVCVLGMHRSGSSLVTGVLQGNGFYLGKGLVFKSKYNADGHYENRFIVNMNKKILKVFGGTWSSPPNLPCNWLDNIKIRLLLSEACRYRDKELRDLRTFAFKDPRSSLTYPFWERVFPGMHYVIVERAKNSVIRSIVKRNSDFLSPSRFFWRKARFLFHNLMGAYEPLEKIDEKKASDIYDKYYSCCLKIKNKEKVYRIKYENILAEPEGEVGKLLRNLGVSGSKHVNVSMVNVNHNHESIIDERN